MIVALIVLAIIMLFYGTILFEVHTLIKLTIKSREASKKLHNVMKEALNDSKEMTEETNDSNRV